LIFKNDGFLIPGALREKIFEPFYRMKETENQKGTGIGLALSRSLAQLHKGVLVLEAPEDNMNVFSLTLSINQESTVLVNAASPEMPIHSSTNTML
jgi:signal transduction histidine kinase